MQRNAGRDHAMRRRTGVHHRRRRRLDRPAARHRRAGRATAGLRRGSRPTSRDRARRPGARRALDLARGRARRLMAPWSSRCASSISTHFPRRSAAPTRACGRCSARSSPAASRRTSSFRRRGRRSRATKRSARGSTSRPWRCCGAISPSAPPLYPARLARSAVAIGALARRVGADLIHTNMEVLLEGGLAARALGLPHVLHYRGNTIDRPKWAFDLLVAAWTRAADRIFCISGATAEIFRRRGHRDSGSRCSTTRSIWTGSDPVRLQRRSARRWARDPGSRWWERSVGSTRARISRRSCGPPRGSRPARRRRASRSSARPKRRWRRLIAPASTRWSASSASRGGSPSRARGVTYRR